VIELLKEWAKTYFFNKDLLMGKKPKIEEKDDHIVITNQDGSHVIVIVKEKLESVKPVVERFSKLEEQHKPIKLTLVLYNKKENIELVVSGWKELIGKQNLTVLFVNPHANDKWSVNPYIHDKIADKKSLKKGLLSLYETVEPV
jgi:hypothetical protein